MSNASGFDRGKEGNGLTIEIHPSVRAELEYMAGLHREYGAPARMESLEELVAYILGVIADGSRRPGSWERELLIPMGLVAETDLHHEYRPFDQADYESR